MTFVLLGTQDGSLLGDELSVQIPILILKERISVPYSGVDLLQTNGMYRSIGQSSSEYTIRYRTITIVECCSRVRDLSFRHPALTRALSESNPTSNWANDFCFRNALNWSVGGVPGTIHSIVRGCLDWSKYFCADLPHLSSCRKPFTLSYNDRAAG